MADFLSVKLVNNMIINLLTFCEWPVSHDWIQETLFNIGLEKQLTLI